MLDGFKPIDRVREYGNQTEKVEATSILYATIDDWKKFAKKNNKKFYLVCGKGEYPVYIAVTEEQAKEFIGCHSHYDCLHIEIAE